MMSFHIEALKKKAETEMTNGNLKAVKDVIEMMDRAGSEQGRLLRSRQISFAEPDSLIDFMVEKMQSLNVSELTTEQKIKVKEVYEADRAAKQKYYEKVQELENAAAKKDAEVELKKISKSRSSKVSPQERVDAAKKRIQERLAGKAKFQFEVEGDLPEQRAVIDAETANDIMYVS